MCRINSLESKYTAHHLKKVTLRCFINSSQECIPASLLWQSLLRPIRSLATNAAHGPNPANPRTPTQDPNPGHCDPLVRDLACESADPFSSSGSLGRFLARLRPV